MGCAGASGSGRPEAVAAGDQGRPPASGSLLRCPCSLLPGAAVSGQPCRWAAQDCSQIVAACADAGSCPRPSWTPDAPACSVGGRRCSIPARVCLSGAPLHLPAHHHHRGRRACSLAGAWSAGSTSQCAQQNCRTQSSTRQPLGAGRRRACLFRVLGAAAAHHTHVAGSWPAGFSIRCCARARTRCCWPCPATSDSGPRAASNIRPPRERDGGAGGGWKLAGLALAAQQGFGGAPGASTAFDYSPRGFTPAQRFTQVLLAALSRRLPRTCLHSCCCITSFSSGPGCVLCVCCLRV